MGILAGIRYIRVRYIEVFCWNSLYQCSLYRGVLLEFVISVFVIWEFGGEFVMSKTYCTFVDRQVEITSLIPLIVSDFTSICPHGTCV